MADPVYNVLFLCIGNSARPILESLLNTLGKGRFRALGAGSHPDGRVNPFALELLARDHFPTAELRSKSRAEFSQPAVRQARRHQAAAGGARDWEAGMSALNWMDRTR